MKYLASFSSKLLFCEISNIAKLLKKKVIIDNFYGFSLYNLLLNQESFFILIQNLYKYHYLCFTSRNAVLIFFQAMDQYSIILPKHLKFIIFGEKTYQELKRYCLKERIIHINTHLFNEINLFDYFDYKEMNQIKIIHLTGDKASSELKLYFKLYNIYIDKCLLYKNRMISLCLVEYLKYLSLNPNYIFFTSYTSIEYFIQNKFHLMTNLKLVTWISIGKKTTKAIKKQFNSDNIIELNNNISELKYIFDK